MIPEFIRVAAIDNEQEHLDKIYKALVGAGYWALPFLYDLNTVMPEPRRPYNGIRLVFSDIHLVSGGMNNMAQQALAIIRALKKVVCDGPYVIIFWTQYPTDAEEVYKEILARGQESGLVLPAGFGCISKSLVLSVEDAPAKLPELVAEINSAIERSGALLLSISWEERVSQAAVRTTHRLFELAQLPAEESSLDVWHKLLAHLSTESVGIDQVRQAPVAALDSALLPILEDRLLVSTDAHDGHLDRLLAQQFGNRPSSVSSTRLNTHYLVSTLGGQENVSPASRGVVSVIDRAGWDANIPSVWGCSCEDAIKREFLLSDKQGVGREVLDTLIPCVVTLTPECDDVQGKVSSYRYLLSLLIPYSDDNRSLYFMRKQQKYSNLSVFDAGVLSLDLGEGVKDYCLLISCNRFFALPTRDLQHATPKLRLRRATLEELSHHYATHARRPGVMRFSLY